MAERIIDLDAFLQELGRPRKREKVAHISSKSEEEALNLKRMLVMLEERLSRLESKVDRILEILEERKEHD